MLVDFDDFLCEMFPTMSSNAMYFDIIYYLVNEFYSVQNCSSAFALPG